LLVVVCDACTTLGEAEDHERGVVAAVEALHGLEDVVNCVDGLLTELIDEDAAGFVGR